MVVLGTLPGRRQLLKQVQTLPLLFFITGTLIQEPLHTWHLTVTSLRLIPLLLFWFDWQTIMLSILKERGLWFSSQREILGTFISMMYSIYLICTTIYSLLFISPVGKATLFILMAALWNSSIVASCDSQCWMLEWCDLVPFCCYSIYIHLFSWHYTCSSPICTCQPQSLSKYNL